MTTLADLLFPVPENEPAGRWEVCGDDSTWIEDEEVADG
jgi:hypothetical protein